MKVLDFGLAKAWERETASGNNSPTLTLEATTAGAIMGTAGYMSPEQARGKPVDKRADIWAFGVVLFEMLSGKMTFEGETVSDTLAAVLRADIDWKLLPVSTPPKVQRLLRRCLDRDVKKRLRDLGDAWLEVDAPEEVAAALAPVVVSRQPRMWWLGWAAAAVVGCAGVGWALLHRTADPPRPVVRWEYTQKAYFGLPVLSRDGTRLAYTELNGSGPRAAVREMDQLAAKPLPGSDGLVVGAFSPDGQWLAGITSSEYKVKKIPASGGTPVMLADLDSYKGMSWGDDGTILCGTNKGLVRISSSGGMQETLTTVDKAHGELWHGVPHFLPGARAAVFTIASGTGRQIAALDLKTRKYHVVASDGLDATYAPTGHLLILRGGALFAQPFDADKLTATGQETPLIEGVSLFNSLFGEYTISDGGQLIYVVGSDSSATALAWVDMQGHQQPLSDKESWGTGRLSPDGRRIANAIYAATVGAGNPQDIWVLDAERKTRTRLTFGGVNATPIWTADGRRITYAATADGKNSIKWVAADGSGRPEELVAADSPASPGSWSPDGKFLLYSQSADKRPPRIFVLPVSSGAAAKPYLLHDAQANEFDAQFSPDGRWVAYVSQETGMSEIYVQPFPGPGGKQRVSTQGGDTPRWARNGKEIYYRSTSSDVGLAEVDVQAGQELRLGLPKTFAKGLYGTTFDVAPDGKRFLVELTSGTTLEGRQMTGIDNWFEELKRRVPVKR